MIYPEYLKKGSTVGICAPSAGVGHKLDSFERSRQVLEGQGYRIIETKSVRLDDARGGGAQDRGKELNELFADPSVDMVMAASGGDFLDEMLPYADFDLMRRNPKWLMGASDPTGILYPYTTICDVATIYGLNAGSYDCQGFSEDCLEEPRQGFSEDCQEEPRQGFSESCLEEPRQGFPEDCLEGPCQGFSEDCLEGPRQGDPYPGKMPRYMRDSLRIIRGGTDGSGRFVQTNSEKHLPRASFLVDQISYDTKTVWTGSEAEIHASGRCIGGCVDVLKDLIGTKFDGTHSFLRRYARRDGVIWYFDNFALSAEMLYRTFLQMRYAGWFEGAQAILLGRTLFEKSESGMTYGEALDLAFGKPGQAGYIPHIGQMDIGHTVPHMTMINGAMLEVSYQNGGGSLAFALKS